jgi:general secretion pathway protein K
MRIKIAPKNRGIALIIVLIVIVVFGVIAGHFAASMKVETVLARHASFSSELDWMGRSGVEVAKWVLAQGSQGPNAAFDSLKQKWAGGPGETNDALAGIDLKNYPMGNGTLSIDIIDLDRKFNINLADEMILRQALTLIGADAGSFTTIISSIRDWIDRDGNQSMSGTESEAYEQHSPPYFCKDGPIDDLSELLLIRGISENPGIYYGSGDPSAALFLAPGRNASSSHFEQPTYAVGLVDLFTPLSRGQLNINTVSATVLQLMPEIDENVASAIIQARAGPNGVDGDEDDIPYRNPAEIAARVPGFVNPAAIANLTRYFTVRSSVFEVHVTATVAGSSREYVAILRRDNPKLIQTLNLYWK